MRHAARYAAFVVGCSSLFALSACGTQNLTTAAKLPAEERITEDSPYYEGAKLFDERCSGCHTLDVVGAHGSSVKASDKEPSDGPNFNQRKETRENVLYALRNGGFSGAIMPQNLATGAEAEAIADFLAKYAGSKAKIPAAPKLPAPGGEDSSAATAPAVDAAPTTP